MPLSAITSVCGTYYGNGDQESEHLPIFLMDLSSQHAYVVRQCCYPHVTNGKLRNQETKGLSPATQNICGRAGIESRSLGPKQCSNHWIILPLLRERHREGLFETGRAASSSEPYPGSMQSWISATQECFWRESMVSRIYSAPFST